MLYSPQAGRARVVGSWTGHGSVLPCGPAADCYVTDWPA